MGKVERAANRMKALVLGTLMTAQFAAMAVAGSAVGDERPLVAKQGGAGAAAGNTATPQDVSTDVAQNGNKEEIERLRQQLTRAGADGREAREAAVVRLMGMPEPAAHRVLQLELQRNDDPEAVRLAVLQALQRHLLGNPATLFGGAGADARSAILTGYVSACAPFWREPAVVDGPAAQLRRAARIALQRVPARELDAAARVLLAAATTDVGRRVEILRCLADMQQTLFAPTIAQSIEAADEVLRDGARRALQMLIYADEPIETQAQFEAWWQANSDQRYVDLVERAARTGPRPVERLREELARLRVEAAREFVSAHLLRTPGIDWAALRERIVVDDAAVLDACLEIVRGVIANGLPAEDAAAPRQAFCRALLQRFHRVPVDKQVRRALLLEVASYLAKPEEGELAAELVGLLMGQLDAGSSEARVAAVRALRRFPSAEHRRELVRRALAMLTSGDPDRDVLAALFDTLASRVAPRWSAPGADDADKADWLRLVEKGCRSDPQLELRTKALVLAQTLDGKDGRVPEVFPLLLALAKDGKVDTKYRSTCLIYLQAWRNDEDLADDWVVALQELVADTAPELRLQAAESMVRLPESTNPKRGEWLNAVMTSVRDRLVVETEASVLRALVDFVQVCGREPHMPERAIGALKFVLAQMGNPVPAEHQFRLEPVLQALATIAADPRADRGQWLGACAPLLMHGKRQSLRLVLQSHAAIDLAKDVGSADAGAAERARQAMRAIIETAALKQARESWTSTEELQREARDVRTAFGALDPLDEAQRLERPVHRLLRLEVDLATGRFQEVVARAQAWLGLGGGSNGGSAKEPFSDEQKARVRMLAAEAQLALSKPEAALALLDERGLVASGDSAAIDLTVRIARALSQSDLRRATDLFERALAVTAPEDPAFRGRLLDWMQHQLRLDPASRPMVLERAAPHTAAFQNADCPAEQREAFEALRTTKRP
jgi:hypothetical protein